ncbi:hypothetical protein [Paraburkholderia humisilvae]|nr:hypothetical protein [Paraburkholderia humisilvae]
MSEITKMAAMKIAPAQCTRMNIARKTRDVRIGSVIVELGVNARSGRAESGRIYKSVNPTGYNSDVEYVFNHLVFLNDQLRQWQNAPTCRDLRRH